MPVCEVRESEVFLMWVVIAEYKRGIMSYTVENTETGERRGTFDCQPWAQAMADELNRVMTEEEAKAIILHDPHGNIVKRMEAIAVARKVLGEECTMKDIWEWADK